MVEFWPGAGWYTDIIAPYLAATGGAYYAVGLQAPDAEGRTLADAFQAKLTAAHGLYGKVQFTAFGPTSGPVAPTLR